jgi:hypothetical protein
LPQGWYSSSMGPHLMVPGRQVLQPLEVQPYMQLWAVSVLQVPERQRPTTRFPLLQVCGAQEPPSLMSDD